MASPAIAASCPIVALVAQVEAETIGIVIAADKLEAEFREAGLMYDMDINPRQCGFDPENRGGEGGNPQEVLLLASDIAFVGWSWLETRHAICCEVKPGDKTVEHFNRDLCEGSGLAPVEEDSIRFGSLSCGHTNMGLRAIAASVPSDCPLLGEGGALSLGKLRVRDPEYAKAVVQGLHWKVLRWEVRERFPEAMRIVISARNVAGHVQRKENEMQGLVQLQSLAASSQRQGKDPDWAAIRKAVLRTRPPFAESLDSMIAFVAAKAGGVRGEFLQFLRVVYRQFVNPSLRAAIPAALYRELADFPYHYCALAAWETAYTCPLDNIKHGVCSMITAAEVGSLAKCTKAATKAKLTAAEGVLREARLQFAATGLPANVVTSNALTKIFARLDINMGRFVLAKQESSKKTYSSALEVGRQFASELQAAFPKAKVDHFLKLWPRASAGTPTPTTVSAESAAQIALYNLNAAGEVTDVLGRCRAQGMEKGGVVRAGTDDEAYRIISFDEDAKSVALESCADAASRLKVSADSFLQDYKPFKREAAEEKHPGWPRNRVRKTQLGQTLANKAVALVALDALSGLLDTCNPIEERVDVFVKPARRVVAAKALESRTLVLLPETTNVKAVQEGSDEAEAAASGLAVEVRFAPPAASGLAAEAGAAASSLAAVAGAAASGMAAAEPAAEETPGDDAGAFPSVVFSDAGESEEGDPEDKAAPSLQYFLMPCAGQECMAPFWLVGSTTDEKKANLGWGEYRVQQLVGADAVGSLKPLAMKRSMRRKSGERPNVEDETVQKWVDIPVLVSTKRIAAGEELVVYRSAQAKREKAPAPITMAMLAKRQRR